MNTLESWRPVIEVMGWTLIHFTWQGTLVALTLSAVMRMLRGASTSARYAAACGALLLMLVLPLGTMALISLSAPDRMVSRAPYGFAEQPESQPLAIEIEPTTAPTQTGVAKPPPSPSFQSLSLVRFLPWMILFWLTGVIFFSMRLAGGWLYTQRLKSYGTRLLEDEWRETLRRLCGQLRVRRPVRLLESALINVPMVIGWLRPVILLPASALSGLTPQQLEAIIAHELAHIRRHDYVINLLQALVETLLFYHPAVWWVSRRIRQEREHCCDDLAVAVCGDAFAYARALLEMEQLRVAGPQLAVAANGGMLMNRIQRLVGARPQHTNRFAGLIAGVIALTTVVSFGVGAQISIFHKSHTGVDQRIGAEVFDARRAETARYESAAASIPSPNKAPAPQTAPVLESQENIPADVAERIGELSSPIPEERAAAACALGTMTTRAAPAIPNLIALLSDGSPIDARRSCKKEPPFEDEEWQPRYEQVREPSPGEAATHALMAIGKPALEPLMTALTHGDHWRTRKNAAWALAHRGHVVEQLIAALKDEAWQVRAQAAYALFQRGGSSPGVVSALIETALGDSAWQARAQAAMALGQKGDSRVDVVMPLIAALKDGHVQVRLEAARGLWECADSRAFVPMIAALKDEDPEVRARVAKALGNRADNPEVELLIAALNDNDENVRTGARRALNVVKQRLRGQITNLRPVTIPD